MKPFPLPLPLLKLLLLKQVSLCLWCQCWWPSTANILVLWTQGAMSCKQKMHLSPGSQRFHQHWLTKDRNSADLQGFQKVIMKTFAIKPLCQIVFTQDITKAAFTYLDSLDFFATVYNGIIQCSKKNVRKPFAESSRKTFYVPFYWLLLLDARKQLF